MNAANNDSETPEFWTIRMTDHEWEIISKLRIFRSGEVQEARAKVDSLVLMFRVHQIDREHIPKYRATLASAVTAVRNLERSFSKMEKLSVATKIQVNAFSTMIKHPHRALLEKEHIHVMTEALHLLDSRLKEGFGSVTTGDKGTTDVYHLVNILNKVVMEHSDGGRLNRSNKNVPGIGNNVGFVVEVLKIACQYTDREIGPGTIIEAIRHIEEPLETLNLYSFHSDFSESEMDEDKDGILRAVFCSWRTAMKRWDRSRGR